MLVLFHYTDKGMIGKVIYCHYTNSAGKSKVYSLYENEFVFLRGIVSFLVKIPISLH